MESTIQHCLGYKLSSDTKKKIELNVQFRRALDVIESTNHHVFITGKAGTGKSTLLDYFRNITNKPIVVLAPTGVAALNVKGQTIHSFFRFKPDITPHTVKKFKKYNQSDSIYKKVDAIVIDEISMVRADLLDCVDQFLRLNGKNKHLPFGGVQMVFIGDLYQLPPVVTSREKGLFNGYYQGPYFFNARVFDQFQMEFIELEKIYRQKDRDFIDLLNAIRNRSVNDDQLKVLNQRFQPDFDRNLSEFSISLTTTNAKADEINLHKLDQLAGKTKKYVGTINGKFDVKSLVTPVELHVKVGAQIMLLNNDSVGRFVNGSIGQIIDIDRDANEGDSIIVELSDGPVVEVSPYTWEVFDYNFNATTHQIESNTVGSFTQYPMKLAWAVTIHKSQGKTFDNVVIDIGHGTFSHGQMYVALSRCTSLEGIILRQQIQKRHIIMDWQVVKFITKYQYGISEKKCSLADKVNIINQAIQNKKRLKIIYLKASDEKSERVIEPYSVGQLEYNGKQFLGVEAYCCKREEDRIFRVDRILDILN